MYKSTSEAYLKEYNESIQYAQMSQDDARVFITLFANNDEMNDNFEFQQEVDSSFLSKIIKKRLEVLDKSISYTALAALSIWADRAGSSFQSV
ncbi:MAG: hypothetical protein WC136_04970 [Sphaerochaeta sp.]